MKFHIGGRIINRMCFYFDISPITLLLLLLNSSLLLTLTCDKSFTYYEEYGQNSFNVSCSGITKGYEHILENITINNEISLTITDSVLENVTADIFKNVKNIKILNVNNCTFEFDRRAAIFGKLQALEALVIHDTHIEIDNQTLQGLESLKRLDLSNNSVSEIEPGALKDLVNLDKLELVDNHVKNLQNLQLCELKKLKSLILRQNIISDLKSYHFFCLNNGKSLGFNINNQPSLPNLDYTYYFSVAATTYDLVDLDLSFNQIVELGYSLENLGKLKNLNLGYNKLTSAKQPHFKWLYRLQKLILRNNQLRSFDSRIFVNKTQLNFVDLSYNSLSEFSVSNMSQLQQLNLEYNNLIIISLRKLNKLQKVNLGCNKLTSLKPDAFQEVPNLVSLNLAGNSLDLSGNLFQNLQGLKYLSLSNNSLNDMPGRVFLGLKNLRGLDLSFNILKTLNPNTFHDLQNVEILNLSSNAIESLSYNTLEPLKNLRTLDIAANKLLYIEYDRILSKLPGLSNINIKFNQLTCENLGQIIAFLKQRHIVYTNSERLDLDNLNQNVAGIPCRTAVKQYTLETKPKTNTLFNVGIFCFVVLASILTGVVTYRFYIYLKRRRYRADEFELVLE